MKGKLHKVESVRVFEQAVDQIRDLILNGILSPGEKLPPEQELSRQLNVSRSSIREALRVLEAEGLILVRRGAGAYVSDDPTPNGVASEWIKWLQQREETLLQLLQVRESIECLTASLAAERASDEVIQFLQKNFQAQCELIARMDDEEEDFTDKLASLDAEFHLAISEASGNIVAHEIISHILPAYNESNKAVIYVGRRQRLMEKEHKAILDALINHDPKAAETAIRSHLSRVRLEVSLPGQELDAESS